MELKFQFSTKQDKEASQRNLSGHRDNRSKNVAVPVKTGHRVILHYYLCAQILNRSVEPEIILSEYGSSGDFSSLSPVQTGPEIHSASYEISTGGKGGRV